jgi:hypothetical protein
LPSLAAKTVTGGRLNAAAAVSTSSIHVTDPVLLEGDSGTTELVFTVSRRGDAAQSLTLDWTTANGTATAGSDYVAGSGQVIFGVGVMQQTISIVVNGDDVGESDETLYVNLVIAAGNTTIADTKIQGTIQNDDAPTISSLTDSSDPVKQGQTLTASVTGSPESVAFYRDSNGNGTLNVGTDTLLGNGSDGWSVSVGIPVNFAIDTYTYFAQGTFNSGASTTNVATTFGDVIKKGGNPNGSSSSLSTATSTSSPDPSSSSDSTTTQDVVLPPINSAPLLKPVPSEEEPADEMLMEEAPVIIPEEQAELDTLFGDLDGSLQDELLTV